MFLILKRVYILENIINKRKIFFDVGIKGERNFFVCSVVIVWSVIKFWVIVRKEVRGNCEWFLFCV